MSNNFLEKAGVGVDGHVLIKDAESGEILLDKYNAINFQNFALAMASSLGGVSAPSGGSFVVSNMAFGNNGTMIDAAGNVTYKTPNVDTASGQLYNQTYIKEVISADMSVIQHPSEPFSDLVTTVTLNYGEPTGQDPLDDASNMDGDYVFDELGLVTDSGLFLTHLIFHPIHKSANRQIQVIYTIRIRAGQ